MKKRHLLLSVAAVACVLLMMGLAACGGDDNTGNTENTETTAASAEELTPEQMNAEMIGVWLPAEGVENDKVIFGYFDGSGEYNDDASGQLCIQVNYGKYEGGGASAAEYAYQDGKLIYTTFYSNYSVGGSIDENWTVETEKLTEGKAVINGVAYEKVTDDPSDPDQISVEIMDSRMKTLLAGTWKSSEGAAQIKLDENGDMEYKGAVKSVDGVWQNEGGMTISLAYYDPDTGEETFDYYHYEIDEDYLQGTEYRFDRQ